LLQASMAVAGPVETGTPTLTVNTTGHHTMTSTWQNLKDINIGISLVDWTMRRHDGILTKFVRKRIYKERLREMKKVLPVNVYAVFSGEKK
jgi:hypothetical protein